MRDRDLVLLIATVALTACTGHDRRMNSGSSTARAEGVPARWRIVDSSTSGTWWDPMVDSGTVYRIRVTRGKDSVDVSEVIAPLPVLVADTAVAGIKLGTGEGNGRELFRVALPGHRTASWPLPDDMVANFTDVAISPDGQYMAYVAEDHRGMPVGVVRRFPDGPVVVRGPPAAGCECDTDPNHARWVTSDSFEIAVVNRAAASDSAPGWLLTAGRMNPPRERTVGLRDEPAWHEPRLR